MFQNGRLIPHASYRDLSSSATTETLTEIRTVRELVTEPEETEKYIQTISYSNNLLDFASNLQRVIGSLYWSMFILASILVQRVGVPMVRAGLVGPAELMTLSGMVAECAGRLHGLSYFIPEIAQAMPPAARICEILDTRSKIEPDLERDAALKPEEVAEKHCKPKDFKGYIQFKDVEFTYPTIPDKQILKKLTFDVKVGDKVALVGPTGCGKSSTIRLVEQFYRADKGSVLVDGIPIQNYDVHFLRRQIAVVAQETVLFDRTLKVRGSSSSSVLCVYHVLLRCVTEFSHARLIICSRNRTA